MQLVEGFPRARSNPILVASNVNIQLTKVERQLGTSCLVGGWDRRERYTWFTSGARGVGSHGVPKAWFLSLLLFS